MIKDQIKALNDTYLGRTGGAFTGFDINLAGIDRTQNAAWFSMTAGSAAEAEAKAALRRGDAGTLNIYTTDGGGFLGWQSERRWRSHSRRASTAGAAEVSVPTTAAEEGRAAASRPRRPCCRAARAR
jgi:hypothetical protein